MVKAEDFQQMFSKLSLEAKIMSENYLFKNVQRAVSPQHKESDRNQKRYMRFSFVLYGRYVFPEEHLL
jgi:hypothetical protein